MALPTVQITGKVLAPDGRPPRSGSITCRLSHPGSVLDGAVSQRVATEVVARIGSDGSVSFALTPNDAITPSGTSYLVTVSVSVGGKSVSWTEVWQLASVPNPIDIGAVPRLDMVPGVAVIDAPTVNAAAAAAQASATASASAASASATAAASARDAALAAVADPGSFSVTATGSTTARPLKDRAADMMNVRDFGAKGDGVTDDAPSLASMIATLGAAARTVYVPAGSYVLASSVIVPSTITVRLEAGASFTGAGSITFRGEVAAAKGRALRKILALRSSDATITDLRLVPFEVEATATVNRVAGYVGVTDVSGKLFEVAIYDANFAKVVSTEVREIPAVGDFESALPETTLQRGRYYWAITTNSTVAQFGVNAYAGAITATAAFPAPATAASPASTAAAPAASIYEKDLPAAQGLFSYADGSTVRVYGIDPATSQPWGWNTLTARLAVSVSQGAAWSDRMTFPPFVGESLYDLAIDSANGKVYALGSNLSLFVSSDLSSTATWTNITCPTTTGLRHPVAVGRPYGIAIFNGYVFIGEYSGTTTGEFAPDGPRILRYSIAAGTWAQSIEIAGARHIHSFYAPGAAALWVSVGDAGYAGIGIWRLTPAQMGAGAGGTDAWSKWTNQTAPFTDHYPVDFIVTAAAYAYKGLTAPIGIYASSDRPGKHLLYSKTTGAIGSFNLSARVFQRAGGPAGETVRSVVIDPGTGNIYYWTAETTEIALYVSPPPYTQAVKLRDFAAAPGLMTRAVKSGDFIMMFDERFHVEKFVGQ